MSDRGAAGDGAGASAAIEAWLARRPPPPADALALLELKMALTRVCEAAVVRRDAEATRILAEARFATDMDELTILVDRLGRRVAAITDGAAAARTAAPAARRPARRMLRL